MRTLNRYIFFSYLGPFVLTLFISLFVLEMQFLWLYIDDLAGKGLGLGILAQIFYYVLLTVVPLALPLAILLSSIMTFGSMGEHYELAALKSTGLSLWKIMQPLIIFSFLLGIAAFFFSNNVIPYATLKSRTLIWDVSKQKPAINIKEGAFYNGIDKYVIRVEKKDPDGKTLHDVMIYDHSSGMGNTVVVIADKGKMEMSDDSKYFIISLENGHSYDEVTDQQGKAGVHPLIRTTFREKVMKIDLSGFTLGKTDEDLFKSNYEMMNLGQIKDELDTLELERKEKTKVFYKYMIERTNIKHIGMPVPPMPDAGPKKLPGNVKPVPTTSKTVKTPVPEKASRHTIIANALTLARNAKSETQKCMQEFENIDNPERYLAIVWHKKFTLSFACVVLFFIGAPLGAIIRKGGLGMPVVISILFFIFYWVISIIGEKFSKEGVIPPYIGMWISTLVLLPIGIFLTRKATADSTLFDADSYIKPIIRFFTKLFRKADTLNPDI